MLMLNKPSRSNPWRFFIPVLRAGVPGGKSVAGLLLLMLPLLLSSCTPTHELKKLSIVEGVGMDEGDSGSVNMTFQIFNASGGGQQSNKGGGGESDPLLAVGNGESAFDAVRNATLQNQNRLYFADAGVYLLGEELGRAGLDKVEDFFERPTDIRPMTRLAIVRDGTAYSAFTAKKSGKTITADEMQSMLDNYGVSSKIWNYDIRTLCEDESTKVTDIALPALRVSDAGSAGQTVQADGTAVFRKNKLVGYLDEWQTRGLMWVKGDVVTGMIVVSPPEGGKVTLEITSASSKVTPKMQNSRMGILVNIKAKTNIVQLQDTALNVLNPSSVTKLETLQSEEIRQEVLSAVNTALHSWNADIFGFGMKLYHDSPESWRSISGHWSSYMATMPIEVKVDSVVAQSAMTTN